MSTQTFFNCEPGEEPFEQLMREALSPDAEAEEELGTMFLEGDFV
jgi:hypothetical protein